MYYYRTNCYLCFFTLETVELFCEEHSLANLGPGANEDTPFVVNHWCGDPDVDEESIFRMAITSLRLLALIPHGGMYHADTSYKLNWQGFPCHIVGFTDRGRQFHPILMGVCSTDKTADFELMG